MATLNIPYSFTAGTPAVASQVNANFDAIVNWANGGISTDAFGLLTARTISLPSAPLPLKTIVPVYQTAAEPALYIVNNSQGVPVTIVQDQAFGSSGKAVIKISDTTTQIQSGSPTVWLDLASAATAPAFLVQHGSVDTMRLTRTQLDLFNGAVQATSAGVVSATTLNTTTVAATDVNTTNVTATGLLDLTAPASDAIVAEIKGRSSDNNAIVQFKSNDDATVYASATSSPSGLTLNLPDTADSYTFKVNDVTKAVINNSGIDAQYLYGTLPPAIIPSNSQILQRVGVDPNAPGGNGSWYVYLPGYGTAAQTFTLATITFTVNKPVAYVGCNIFGGYFQTESVGYQRIWSQGVYLFVEMGGKVLASQTGTVGGYNSSFGDFGTPTLWMFAAGTYTATLKATMGASYAGGSFADRTFRGYDIVTRVTEL